MPQLDGTEVLVTGSSVADSQLETLRSMGARVVNPPSSFPPDVLTEDELHSLVRSADAYLMGGDEQVTAEVFQQAHRLKVVAFLGVGFASFVDADAARQAQIAVTNTPGALSNSVAEMAVAMLLDARRQIFDHVYASRIAETFPQEKRHDLFGHAVGIVGLGATGTRAAEILTLGFGAKVSYYSRTRKATEEARLALTYSQLEDLVSSSESLILMVPETAKTSGMIGRSLLSLRSSLEPLDIVTTARPEIIDPEDLLWALDEGLVESAWFDDFYRDSTPATDRLKTHPGVKRTPHIASLTHDARDAMARMCVESIVNILTRGDDAHIVNR